MKVNNKQNDSRGCPPSALNGCKSSKSYPAATPGSPWPRQRAGQGGREEAGLVMTWFSSLLDVEAVVSADWEVTLWRDERVES